MGRIHCRTWSVWTAKMSLGARCQRCALGDRTCPRKPLAGRFTQWVGVLMAVFSTQWNVTTQSKILGAFGLHFLQWARSEHALRLLWQRVAYMCLVASMAFATSRPQSATIL